ncbi:hypothetical protein R2601_03928 [Salipiger bermudensis HTCC2601]|uniref:Uncharacterized protein n=1 Tax=Salipiger bermudensis (strain DSM 26914 / JCM 13377 / KCTC 12554 / HTCC2601) TaxID=314265 RepID=Q0FW60_SALBH|nr:hypothetical protein R2601_03928 [Salipiger bermudensis HTCC2601]
MRACRSTSSPPTRRHSPPPRRRATPLSSPERASRTLFRNGSTTVLAAATSWSRMSTASRIRKRSSPRSSPISTSGPA